MKYLVFCLTAIIASTAIAQTYQERLGPITVADVQAGSPVQLPVLTWGADAATFVANGGVTTAKNSYYDKLGLKFNIVNGDDFNKQVRDYLTGKTPYLRGTSRMVGAVLEVLNKDERTKPVMVLQLSYSLGDHIVARENIKTLNDLKGKKIAIQLPIGPHLDLMQDSLDAAQLKFSDVTLVPCKDLIGDENADSPANRFRKDPSIAACCVITPDMLGLTSGLDSVGSGYEGTVKGAHVLNSTAVMNRSIVDGVWVRRDYFDANKPTVEKFVIGYFQGTEQLLKDKAAYNDGRGSSPSYISTLKLIQRFYGETALPTIENEAHGLICDANIVRLPGNELYFEDPNNLVGFKAKLDLANELALELGYAKAKSTYDKAKWDYKRLSQQVGVKYVAPVLSQGRVNAEAIEFDGIDDDVILSFEIKFGATQDTFSEDEYRDDYDRVLKNAALFGNGVIVVKGHSDTYLLVREFFRAAKAKGLITGTAGSYKFKGKPLDLTKTQDILNAVNNENLSGDLRDAKGSINDPRKIATAAQSLSLRRAEVVKQSVQKYAKDRGVMIDFSQVQAVGAGVSEPKYARPTSEEEMAANRRVEFLVIRITAEAVSGDDFNFDK